MKINGGINLDHIDNSKYLIQTAIYNSPGMKIPISYIVDEAKYIDYYKNNKSLAKDNLEFSKDNAFVISKIDSSNKYSKEYLNCTGIVAIGEDKETGENISFLTHQNVVSFLRDKQGVDDLFKTKLLTSFNKLKEKSKQGSIDVIILGGNDFDQYKEYIETINFLNQIIIDGLGFSASVVGGPTINNIGGKKNNKDIVLNTKERKTYLFKKYSEVGENINIIANKIEKILKI